MLPGNPALPGPNSTIDPRKSMELFHGKLLDRSQQYQANRKQAIQAKSATRRACRALGQASVRLASEGAIFMGGGAIGAGIVLHQRGESWNGRPGSVIALGIACVLASIVGRLAVHLTWGARASVSRG